MPSREILQEGIDKGFRKFLCFFLFSVYLCGNGNEVKATHFLWILELFPEGVYRESLSKMVPEKGTVYESNSWNCSIENGWSEVNGWLLVESRTLSCRKTGAPQTKDLQIFCREHESSILRTEQRINTKGMYLEPDRPADSVYARLSCMPLSVRLR